jgi:nicotinamidase-related amidase
MSTLTDRPHTALTVIDVQNGVVAGAHDRDQVVANIATLVDRARSKGTPVVWVLHSADDLPRDSEPWQLVPELAVADGEPVVHKRYGDSFEDTDLEDVLAGLGVGHLVVSGAQSDACIRSTLHGALVRGYDTTLVADAHTTEDLSAYGAPTPDLVIAHTNLYWAYQSAPGRAAGTVTTEEAFGSPVGGA